MHLYILLFPDSSVGKESACNAGDPSLIPESGRSSGEGIGSPIQYSWAFLVAQLVKNPPAMQETWVWSLCWEDPLKKGKATHSSILAWRITWDCKSVRHDSDFHIYVYNRICRNKRLSIFNCFFLQIFKYCQRLLNFDFLLLFQNCRDPTHPSLFGQWSSMRVCPWSWKI